MNDPLIAQFDHDIIEAQATAIHVSLEFYLLLHDRFPPPDDVPAIEITDVPTCQIIVDPTLSGLTWQLPSS